MTGGEISDNQATGEALAARGGGLYLRKQVN